MAYTAIYSLADSAAVKTAIITLATRPASIVMIGGKKVEYTRSDLPFLRALLTDIQLDLAKQADDGGLCLVQPGGR